MKFESMFSPPVVRLRSFVSCSLCGFATNQPTNHPFLLPLPPSLSVAVREAGRRKREKRSPACHTFHSAHSLTRGADRQSVAQPASQPHATQRRPLAPSFPLRSIGGTRRRRELKHLTRPPQRTTDGRVVNFLLTSSSPAAARAAARRRSPIPQRNVVRRERGRGEQAVEEAAAEAAGALKPSCATTWKRRRRRHSTLKCGDFGGLVLSPVKRGRRHMPHLLRRGNIFQRHEAR